MQVKKIYQKAIDFVFLAVFGFFILIPAFSEASQTYNVGIVGIENRVKNTNLDEYMKVDELFDNPDYASPLDHAQTIFTDVILNGDLQKISLRGVEKTAYSKMARQSEKEFQADQAQMHNAIVGLDKGDTREAVKLFDKKLDYLIYGYINNIAVSHREAFGTSNTILNVSLSVRIVDASTGKIVAVATGRGSASNHGEGYKKAFRFGENRVEQDSWMKALKKAMDQVVDGIIKQA